MDGDIPTAVEGYDPDMTVEEALRKGIIAMLDTGAIASRYSEACGEPPGERKLHPGMFCTRAKGHAGWHAYVYRWDKSYIDLENEGREEAARKALEARSRAMLAREQKKQQELQRVAKEVEKSMAEAAKAAEKMAASQWAELHRMASQRYSPMEGHKKNAKFKDRNVGKVRGR